MKEKRQEIKERRMEGRTEGRKTFNQSLKQSNLWRRNVRKTLGSLVRV
jgi:hypothetical protein